MTSEARKIAEGNLILLCQVGSTVHGVNLPGSSDNDELGVCLEPPEYVIGLKRFEQDVMRSKPDGVRSEDSDTDRTVYSSRKFASLALKGNPTILTLFFAPAKYQTTQGRELQELAPAFASRRAGRAFLGYATQQRERLVGERGQKNVKRPELVEKYGYDCYSDDTEFLTERGWLLYDDIANEDALATVDKDGRIEFQVALERIDKPYDGELHHFHHRYSDCLVTPNHRMLVSPVRRGASGKDGTAYHPTSSAWQFMRAGELGGYQHVRVAGAGSRSSYPISDDEIRIIGSYVSEGCVGKRLSSGEPSVLRFSQKAGGRLEPVLASLPNSRSYPYERETVYTVADRPLAQRVVEQCGEMSATKRLPNWSRMLSSHQAELLLDTLMAGDGTECRTGYRVYYTTSEGLAGDVQALAVLCGRRSNVWGPHGKGMYQVLVQDAGKEIECLSMYSNHTVEAMVGGRIVCFTVPNETLVTRRNGRVAMHGNTKYAMHMLRLGYQGIEYLESGRLTLPMREEERSFILSVRSGEVEIEEVLLRAGELEVKLEGLLTTSPLPEEPDFAAVNSWLVDTHRFHWGGW